MTRGRELALAIGLGVLVRAPFVAVALRVPVDADTAIIGLMARHPSQAPTMWGQPYGSPLEGWLAIPFLLAVEPDGVALRAFYAVLGLLLVPIAYWLAEAVDPRAALPAALLVACPPSYMLLLAVLPPPLYPSTLLLGGVLLILALQITNGWRAGRPELALAALWGVLAGLALWTHLTALSAVLASGAFLVLQGFRQRRSLGVAGLSLLVASAPLWDLESRYRSLWRVVRVHSGVESLPAHFAALAKALPFTLGGLLGAHTPLVADARDVIWAPLSVAVLLAVLYGVSLAVLWPRALRDSGTRLVLLAALLAVLVFLVPIRSQPHTTRYLAALYLPASVGVALAWSGPWRGRLRFAIVALVCGLNLLGGMRLLQGLRALDLSAFPYGAGPLEEVRAFLERHGVRYAFASYEPAYRLTFETDERLVVSQPWNERFPGHPLPYLDAARGAADAAWILPGGRLPHPHAFEAALARSGEHWRCQRIGPLSVYYDITPPLPPTFLAEREAARARPVPGSSRRRAAPSRRSDRR